MMQGKRVSHFVAAAFACAAFVGVLSLPVPHASHLCLGGTASAEESIEISYFYDKLAPYGLWVEHPRFGYVWLPQNVSEDWRPYTVGHWINTKEYGWYWESEEPFAWAVYHYGRWGYDPELGWFWVSGTIWAPGWVEWRYPKSASKKSYVGWAPVGPRMSGYAYGIEEDYEPPVAEAWVFVEPEYIIAEDVYVYAVPVVDIEADYIETTIVYQPHYRGGIVYNRGIPHDHVEAIIGHEIETREFVRVENPNAAKISDDEVQAFAPRVEKAKPGMAPQQVAKSPDEIKPKAKLKTALQEAPKELGPTASEVKPALKEGMTQESKPELGAEPSEPGAPGKVGKEEAPQPPSTDMLGEKEKGPELGKKKEEMKESEAAGTAEIPTEPSGPSASKKGKKKGEIGSAEQPSPPTDPRGKQRKPKSKEAIGQGEEGPGPSAGAPRQKGKGKKQAAKPDKGSPSAGASHSGEDGLGRRGRLSGGGSSSGPEGAGGGGEHGGKKGRFGEAGPSGGPEGQGGKGGRRGDRG